MTSLEKADDYVGLFPWFSEQGDWHVHPDDIGEFRALEPFGRVFKCVGRRDGYLLLHYGTGEYRVRPELFEPVPSPAFDFEEWVEVLGDSRARGPHMGMVRDILWHARDGRTYYTLRIEGKTSTKHYREEELGPLRT